MVKMTMTTKKEIVSKHSFNYSKATKKEKGVILDNLTSTTGLSRDRVTRLLNGSANKKKPHPHKRGRKIKYSDDILQPLIFIWTLLDFPCGKRLVAAIPSFINLLMLHNEFDYPKHVVDKLLSISSSTVDRLLKKQRSKLSLKGRSTTKPSTLLKKNIPTRLGNQWDENKPGFVEVDLVAHCGSTAAGEYVNTLDVTDIYSGWTETRAVLNKAQKHTFDALMFIESQLPFNYLGIDPDNGSEFINNHLYNYCLKHNIVFTRTRPYRKNDNCHVEQKNWMVVRRNIGYDRYEGIDAVNLLNSYYQCLRLFTNFIQPQTKLDHKIVSNNMVKKVYSEYLTPYQRLLNSEYISDDVKLQLNQIYLSINPVSLRKAMVIIFEKLQKLAIPHYR